MTVKSKRGRRRYILFTIAADIDRNRLIDIINQSGSSLYVTSCGNSTAIIRCAPEEVDSTIEKMMELVPGSISICTSGTIKTLREKYPDIPRKEPRHKRNARGRIGGNGQ